MTNQKTPHILMMAAGTGGHIFPALAVADALVAQGATISWLGTPNGMENTLVGDQYPFFAIDMQGLRGKGLARLFQTPWMVFTAVRQVVQIIKEHNIDAVVGFGGYVTVPGGIAAKWCKKPLIIHEQNAVAGMSNRVLSKYADRVLQAFEGVFGDTAITVGNPVRPAIAQITSPSARYPSDDNSPLKVLVVGGSLGAQAINQAVVALLKTIDRPLSLRHQCGKTNHEEMLVAYSQAGIDSTKHTFWLEPFIEDMAKAYAWADVVLCRAGALTVSEIAAAGVAAIFVPLPHAVDDHQTANARFLTEKGAGILLPQNELSGEKLTEIFAQLTRAQCQNMAQNAKNFAKTNATEACTIEILGCLAAQ